MLFQNYHNHKHYSNIFTADSATTVEDYAKRCKELGHKVLSSMEHGFQGRYYEVYEIAKKYNLKFIFGVEAYWVKDRLEKDRTNSHICLLAKNETGRRAINRILSDANIDGYYYKPRVDLGLLLSLPKSDVFVTSACVAYWHYEDIEDITLQLHQHFKENFMLEVQYHHTQSQKDLNKRVIEMSEKYNIDIIMGCDSHYILPEQHQDREAVLYARNIHYDEEDGWFLDYPDGLTAYNRFVEQGILSDSQIKQAINNTNILLEFEDIEFDKNVKLPTLYPNKTQKEKDDIYRKIMKEEWHEFFKTMPEQDKAKQLEHIAEIKKEMDVVINTKMTDYFLIDYFIVKRAIELGGKITKSGRGCFTDKALVHTQETLKSIDKVKVGDKVITHDGSFQKVVKTMRYNIEEPLIKIKYIYGTDTHYPSICTLDHKILIFRNNRTQWVQAKNIEKTDFVCVPKIKIENKKIKTIDLNDYNTFGYKFDDEFIYEYSNNNQTVNHEFYPSKIASELKVSKSSMEKFANGHKTVFNRNPEIRKKFFKEYPFDSQEEYVNFIKNNKITKIKRFIQCDEIFNKFIGLMYGDGFNPEKRNASIGLAINSETNDLNKQIFYQVAERLGVRTYENKSKKKKLHQLYINSKIFREFISKELFISKKGRDKNFNIEWFNQNIMCLKSILEGLRLSDGYMGNGQDERICFDNTSLSLINAYKIICLMTNEGINSLSVRPRYKDKRGWICKPSYKLRLNKKAENNQKQKERIIIDDNYWYLPIKEIEILPKQKTTVYDINVENNNSYLINNMIVHNSGVSFFTNTLLGFSKVDRVTAPVKLYPERFMSESRILETKSLPD